MKHVLEKNLGLSSSLIRLFPLFGDKVWRWLWDALYKYGYMSMYGFIRTYIAIYKYMWVNIRPERLRESDRLLRVTRKARGMTVANLKGRPAESTSFANHPDEAWWRRSAIVSREEWDRFARLQATVTKLQGNTHTYYESSHTHTNIYIYLYLHLTHIYVFRVNLATKSCSRVLGPKFTNLLWFGCSLIKTRREQILTRALKQLVDLFQYLSTYLASLMHRGRSPEISPHNSPRRILFLAHIDSISSKIC